MYCKQCGSEMPDEAIFCSHCGTRLIPEASESDAPQAQAKPADSGIPAAAGFVGAASVIADAGKETEADLQPSPAQAEIKTPAPAKAGTAVKAAAEEAPRKPFFEEMRWNVSEYPDSNTIEKTEDINFDWNTDPSDVPDHVPGAEEVRPRPRQEAKHSTKSAEGIRVSEIFDRVVPQQEVKAVTASTQQERHPRTDAADHRSASGQGAAQPAHASAVGQADKAAESVSLDMGKFSTFNRKNAEFQQMLNQEFEKIRDAGTIGQEQSQADAIARERFDSRQEEMTMDQFLQKEGAVKLYEPKPLESDVLARIEAQEKQRARQKAEEEARLKAEAEARAQEEARQKAEIDRLNSEAEASAAAAQEIITAEEEEIRRRTEAEARHKAEMQAAKLEAIAKRKAAQEQAALQEEERRLAEEARRKAEAEERARAEAEARAKAQAEATRAAEEAARQKAEAELNAAREAARIRAQQEASLAAQEEARFRAEQERRRQQEEMLKQRQTIRERQQARSEEKAAVENQVKDALAQTARMREEEEAKIKAALAGIRSGRFSDTLAAGDPAHAGQTAPAGRTAAPGPVEIPQAQAAPAAAPTSVEISRTPADPAAAHAPAEAPQTQTFAEPLATAPEAIEEAHRATQSHIDEMAKARRDFFSDFPDADETTADARPAADEFMQTRLVDKDDLMSGLNTTKKIDRDDLHLKEEPVDFFGMPQNGTAQQPAAGQEAAAEAAPATEEQIKDSLNEMDDLLNQFASIDGGQEAKDPAADTLKAADDSFFAAFEEEKAVPEEPAAGQDAIPQTQPEIPAQEAPAFAPETTAPAQEVQETPAFAQEAQEAAAEAPAFVQEAAAPAQDHGFFADAAAKAPEEMTSEPVLTDPVITEPFSEAAASDPVDGAIAAAGAATGLGAAASAVSAAAGEKPGLEDTMVMPISRSQLADAQAGADAAAGLSAKELKRLEKEKAKEARKAAKEARKNGKEDVYFENTNYVPADDEEDKPKGGVGRIILMIILIILCIIFALELAGIGIKLLAPTSGAAEFIDNILNNLIHKVTG